MGGGGEGGVGNVHFRSKITNMAALLGTARQFKSTVYKAGMHSFISLNSDNNLRWSDDCGELLYLSIET